MLEHKRAHTRTHTLTNHCSLRPAAASTLPSVAASDSVCRTWGCLTPGDSLAVRKSCLLFIFTAQHSPTLGHSHPCNTSKNLYLPALAAFFPPPPFSHSTHTNRLTWEPSHANIHLTLVSISSATLRFGGRNGFCWFLEDCSPHETHWVCLVLRRIIWPRVETCKPLLQLKLSPGSFWGQLLVLHLQFGLQAQPGVV